MKMIPGWALACAAAIGFAATAFAATPATRVRGTVESVSNHVLSIKTYAGRTEKVRLASTTKYLWALPSSLDDIKQGDFIGVGATGPENDLRALEVTVFPESMRGTGEGHYPWTTPGIIATADRRGGHLDASGMPAGAPPVKGTMTNGTVSAVGGAAPGAPPVKGTMTNGTVAASGTRTAGGRSFRVTYDHGGHVRIFVPDSIVVVRLQPVKHAILAAGQQVFVFATAASGSAIPLAKFVLAGKDGITPP